MTTMAVERPWLLASAAGKVLSRDDILNRMRGIAFDGSTAASTCTSANYATNSRQSPRAECGSKPCGQGSYPFNPFAWEL